MFTCIHVCIKVASSSWRLSDSPTGPSTGFDKQWSPFVKIFVQPSMKCERSPMKASIDTNCLNIFLERRTWTTATRISWTYATGVGAGPGAGELPSPSSSPSPDLESAYQTNTNFTISQSLHQLQQNMSIQWSAKKKVTFNQILL